METFNANKKDVLAAYNDTDAAGKILLQKVFGKEAFSADLWDKIKSFEDGLAYKGVQAEDVLPDVPTFMKEHEDFFHAVAKLVFLADIFRNGWTADYANPKQDKWWPWYEYKSGSGLSVCGSGRDISGAGVAARLCFPTEEMSTRFGKQFLEIYKPFLLY